jgi:hypothetical protein
MSFALSPVTDADFTPSNPNYHRLVIPANRSAADVWADLHGDSPLFWCRGIKRAGWTSPRPHGVGATRTVTLANGMKVDERYFRWEESDDSYVNAFSVESSNLPLFRRFGERYTVVSRAIGSELTWEFVAEPRLPGRAILAKVLAKDLQKLGRDTEKHFS